MSDQINWGTPPPVSEPGSGTSTHPVSEDVLLAAIQAFCAATEAAEVSRRAGRETVAKHLMGLEFGPDEEDYSWAGQTLAMIDAAADRTIAQARATIEAIVGRRMPE